MKLHNLTLENFRSFERFTLNNLGRVNLLVGTNNSGKTSVLEAIFVLKSDRPLSSIWNLLFRRGEMFPASNQKRSDVPTELRGDVKHLFKNHELSSGSCFSLSGESDAGSYFHETRIQFGQSVGLAREENRPGNDQPSGMTYRDDVVDVTQHVDDLVLLTSFGVKGQKPDVAKARLDESGGLSLGNLEQGPVPGKRWQGIHSPHLVSATSLSSHAVARLYNDIILTSEEELVLEAVQLIKPEIKRIAPIWASTEWPGLITRDGIFVRLEGLEDRVPLGSMGDGIWRMLGLALAAVHSRNKILLVDEIDTGLHYEIMDRMWRFLNDCSQRFNVQIIATTHSRDCYQSLAEICREGVMDQSEVTIQRIDRKQAEAVEYTEAMIIAAADNDVEVR